MDCSGTLREVEKVELVVRMTIVLLVVDSKPPSLPSSVVTIVLLGRILVDNIETKLLDTTSLDVWLSDEVGVIDTAFDSILDNRVAVYCGIAEVTTVDGVSVDVIALFISSETIGVRIIISEVGVLEMIIAGDEITLGTREVTKVLKLE